MSRVTSFAAPWMQAVEAQKVSPSSQPEQRGLLSLAPAENADVFEPAALQFGAMPAKRQNPILMGALALLTLASGLLAGCSKPGNPGGGSTPTATGTPTSESTEAPEPTETATPGPTDEPTPTEEPGGLNDLDFDKLMMSPPFPLGDINSVSPDVCAGSEWKPNAPQVIRTETEALELVRSYFQHDPELANQAEILFQDEETRNLIPDPSLRAAFTGLLGTVGEITIGYLLPDNPLGIEPLGDPGKPAFTKIQFADFGANPEAYGLTPEEWETAVAVSMMNPETGQREILFNSKFRGDNPYQLTAHIGHESFHHDRGTPTPLGAEELSARAYQLAIRMDQLGAITSDGELAHPELGQADTELEQHVHPGDVIQANTRRLVEDEETGEVRGALNIALPYSPDISVFPNPGCDFTSSVVALYNTNDPTVTPGNPAWEAYLAAQGVDLQALRTELIEKGIMANTGNEDDNYIPFAWDVVKVLNRAMWAGDGVEVNTPQEVILAAINLGLVVEPNADETS